MQKVNEVLVDSIFTLDMFTPLALFENSRETSCCQAGENVKNDQTQKVPKRTLAGSSPSLKQEVSNGFIKTLGSLKQSSGCFFLRSTPIASIFAGIFHYIYLIKLKEIHVGKDASPMDESPTIP